MAKFIKNFIKYFISALILAGIIFYFFKKPTVENTVNYIQDASNDISNNIDNSVSNDLETKNSNGIPSEIFISVPFTSQAPFGVWDAYHEEACEEASIVMLKYYLDGKKINPDLAEKEIQALIQFEITNYGDYKDTNAEQTVKLFNDFYGLPINGKKLKVVYDFLKDDLKKYLAQVQPMIIPAAGRLLDNPYFTSPGPLYHNLVLVGYDGNKIITNDPGTKRGEGYEYNIDVLYNAIRDFPGKPEDIEAGRKAMIVLE